MAKWEQKNTVREQYSYRIDGSAVMQPELQPEEPRRAGSGKREISRKQARKQSLLRQKMDALNKIQVREQGAIAPASVIGMVAVALLATAVIGLRVQLNEINTELSACSSELTQLQKEEDSLLTQYEQMFDMGSIESGMLAAGRMTKPSSTQTIYLELSEPDNAIIFDQEEGALETLQNKVLRIVEYFQ